MCDFTRSPNTPLRASSSTIHEEHDVTLTLGVELIPPSSHDFPDDYRVLKVELSANLDDGLLNHVVGVINKRMEHEGQALQDAAAMAEYHTY